MPDEPQDPEDEQPEEELPEDDPLHPESNLDNVRQGELYKADGMRRAEMGAPITWRGHAEEAVRWVAEHRERFTTDPVWAVLDKRGVPKPPEERAMGPLMKTAASSWQWCRATGEWVMSSRPEAHRRPIAVYESLIYRRTP